MGLEKYAEKRDFSKTKEPKAGRSKDKDHLMFVIQKHDASRLHYDFRLEMDGVLKSWAIPKGPSTDPKVKRLAMMVEDHPFDYRNFEGIIPKGEYGGGTVIVWDEGTYEPIDEIKGKKAQEKYLLKQLETGSVKIKLHGEKLEGEFALVKTHGMGENGWLLIKHNDEFASAKDITKKDKSILSGKSIENMEKTSEKVWQHGHEEGLEKPKKSGKKKALNEPVKELEDKVDTNDTEDFDVEELLKKAPKSKAPTNIKPMKATLVDEPFDDPDWLYEVKWDGYRAIAVIDKKGAELISRNNLPFDKYYPINKLLKDWQINAVIDGEILVLNDKGISDFGALQNWRSEADGNLVYYVFDILWYEGKNLMDLPLKQRQAILTSILPTNDDRIRQSKVFDTGGIEFFNAAERIGLEGIIAKKASSVYTSDLRSKEWLKIKVHRRQEVIIAGFTKNAGTSKSFSALILALYDGKGKLQYAGKVGTGFSDKLQKEMMEQFKPLITDKSPFEVEPDVDKPSRFRPQRLGAKPTWLKPELVCEVAFAEVTGDGVFRQASFKGMRTDKKAKDVVLETPKDTTETVEEVERTDNDTHAKAIKPVKDTDRKTLLNPKEETQVRKICGHELKFTHLSKVYWPEDGVTKRDMFNYYYQVADYILPYLKDRPMSLNRFPNGIHGPSFYQKDVKGKAPDWITKTFPYTNGEGEHKEYLVGSDESYLLWMASLGCIEMNPWFSRVKSPDNPDYCVIDLDPDKNTFDQVIEAALEVKKVLDAVDVPSCCKTSGSTGMHIYIPLGAKYDYDQSQLFARLVVDIVHKQIPGYTSLERMVANRKGKMYLDFLQNRPGATIAGPYSLRPKPGATVSMPLHWDEVKPGLTMKDFTIFNSIYRLKETGDLFKGVLEKGIDLEKTIKKAKSVFD
ncbi:bifunctional non-homologous end joining protein LigD [Mucilaginibacter gossypiicola]|uniref:DNA ligase (ATP) n=1 Tax=Mucilaginibacter gossypiicola TaxID=551995 RepID=A0A1H8K160_9SPHI|nr:DNA ligase D [Mucilaginibacter gossypiicola]SEN86739.1 bifunctional non-homologous end joining protein LigD [Mucilaginibacter gossypiicola]